MPRDSAGQSIILLALIGVLLLTLLGLRISYSIGIREEYGPGVPLREALHDRATRLTAADAADIQAWMTFDYVNDAFGLPRGYLMQSLGIRDVRYPRLSLVELARSEATTTDAVRTATRAAVAAYAAAHQP